MSEENFDIPSEHNIKSVIKRTQMRGPRCNSSILCKDKGAIKIEDRESFGLVQREHQAKEATEDASKDMLDRSKFYKNPFTPSINKKRFKIHSEKVYKKSKESYLLNSEYLMAMSQNLSSSNMRSEHQGFSHLRP